MISNVSRSGRVGARLYELRYARSSCASPQLLSHTRPQWAAAVRASDWAAEATWTKLRLRRAACRYVTNILFLEGADCSQTLPSLEH